MNSNLTAHHGMGMLVKMIIVLGLYLWNSKPGNC